MHELRQSQTKISHKSLTYKGTNKFIIHSILLDHILTSFLHSTFQLNKDNIINSDGERLTLSNVTSETLCHKCTLKR